MQEDDFMQVSRTPHGGYGAYNSYISAATRYAGLGAPTLYDHPGALLPQEASVEDIHQYFGIFGHIVDDPKRTGHRGFGFVTFAENGVADRVARRSHEICGHQFTTRKRPFCNGLNTLLKEFSNVHLYVVALDVAEKVTRSRERKGTDCLIWRVTRSRERKGNDVLIWSEKIRLGSGATAWEGVDHRSPITGIGHTSLMGQPKLYRKCCWTTDIMPRASADGLCYKDNFYVGTTFPLDVLTLQTSVILNSVLKRSK
ncbi:Uncharacterized protein Fot_21136 [Forsythia ovata]|uniref:RRM domain-containing protein n=1 Tax=Forsythia ovata TaxID=205694 RepID=A0ABD1UTZ5_9LAMI